VVDENPAQVVYENPAYVVYKNPFQVLEVFKRFRVLWDGILETRGFFETLIKRGHDNEPFLDELDATGWHHDHIRVLVNRTTIG